MNKVTYLKKTSLKKNQRGAAILMALFSVTLLTLIAVELVYDTSVNYILSSRKIHELKTRYANKSGENLALFRLYAYQALKAELPAIGESQYGSLMWSFPLNWPTSKEQKSLFDSKINIKISTESGKINVNTLGLPISDLKKQAVIEKLRLIFTTEQENNKEFEEKYDEDYVQVLINQMKDWVDADNQGSNSASESGEYDDDELYPVELFNDEKLPPNRFFAEKSELLLLPNMTPELYRLIEPHISTYGGFDFNLFYIDKDLLRRMIPGIDAYTLNELFIRLTNPFAIDRISNIETLKEALGNLGIDPNVVTNLTDGSSISNKSGTFLIEAESTYGKVKSNLEALVILDKKELETQMLKGLERGFFGEEQQQGSSSSQLERPPKIKDPKPTAIWPLEVIFSRNK